MLDLWQHHLAHLGQDLCVRPRRLTNKMQQRLVLRRCPRRSSHCCHRFDALAFAGHYQPHAIISQRTRPIRVSDDRRKTLDISRKSRFTIIRPSPVHCRLPSPERESRQIADSFHQTMRLSDSVELGGCPPMPRGLGKVQRHLSFKPRLCRSPGGCAFCTGWTCACVFCSRRIRTRAFFRCRTFARALCSDRTCAGAFFTGRTSARAFATRAWSSWTWGWASCTDCTGRTCACASSSAAQAWNCLNAASAGG